MKDGLIILSFLQERFVLCHNRADEEAKIAVLNKVCPFKLLLVMMTSFMKTLLVYED